MALEVSNNLKNSQMAEGNYFMKKRIAIFLIALLLLISSYPATYARDDVEIFVNGKFLYTDVPPMIINDRIMVPLRAIFEALGAKVDWNGATETVTAKKDNIEISMQIGSRSFFRNGMSVILDVPAQVVNDRTLVPLRAIVESFDAEVVWDGDTSTAYISLTSNDNHDNRSDEKYPVYDNEYNEDYEGIVYTPSDLDDEDDWVYDDGNYDDDDYYDPGIRSVGK